MRIDYIKHRFSFYAIALTLLVSSLVMPFVLPVHLGIDMTGGTQSEFQYTGDFQKTQVESVVTRISKMPEFDTKSAINTTSVYKVSGENIFVVEVGYNAHAGISAKDLDTIKTDFQNNLTAELKKESNATLIRYVNIGESFGDYIKKTAYLTLAMIILVISLYIAWAFRGTVEGFTSFSFGAVTAISLFHDVVIAFGLYVATSFFFPEFKIDTFFVTAMLTVLGYSINDTIVIMDRIRSNLLIPANKKLDFGVLVNNAINDTITRSIFTALTVVIVLVSLYFFGPQAIQGFTLALIFGTFVGTYSSVCIAAPLLYDFTRMNQSSK